MRQIAETSHDLGVILIRSKSMVADFIAVTTALGGMYLCPDRQGLYLIRLLSRRGAPSEIRVYH
jgi:hypothetical protein